MAEYNTSIKKSPIFNRLQITDKQPFTIPDSSSFVCLGGAIFNQGIVVGNNKSFILGSLRFNNNTLQYLSNEGWVTITGEKELDISNDLYKNAFLDMYNKTLYEKQSILCDENIKMTSTSPGKKGDMVTDCNYLYVCVMDNVWKRIELKSW